MEQMKYLILGWLLGLFGTRIISHIELSCKKAKLQKAIFTELKNIAVRFLSVYGRIEAHLGTRNKKSITYQLNLYQKYKEYCSEDMLYCYEILSKAQDAELTAASKLLKAKSGISLNLKKYSLPLVEASFADLSLFNPDLQRKISEISAHINMFNEDVDVANYFYRLTFDPSCMKTNKDIVRSNLNEIYKITQRSCTLIIDKITEVVEIK